MIGDFEEWFGTAHYTFDADDAVSQTAKDWVATLREAYEAGKVQGSLQTKRLETLC